MERRVRSAIARAALAAACLADLAGCRAGTPRPDVVLVLIDTLRPDHLGFYGYAQDTAPFLAGLARESAVFARAFSTSSWTAPATASVFTGLYPTHHGLTDGFRAQRRRWLEGGGREGLRLMALPGSLETLPERFRAGGYRTFGLVANINLDARTGFARGFDRFRSEVRADAEALAGHLREWEAELAAPGPSFLYLHFMDVHEPLDPRPPWYRESAPRPFLEEMRLRYDSEIHYLDAQLAALYPRLHWDEAWLVVVSDHGEEFLEHGRYGHGFSLHGELNRVVLLLRPPRGGFPPRVIRENVSLVDLLPTLCELAGLPPPEPRDGISLVPLMRGDADPATTALLRDRTLFAHRAEHGSPGDPVLELWAAIRGPWKLIAGDAEPREQLFQMEEDPGESRDLTGARGDVAGELRERLAGFRAAPGALAGAPVEVELAPDTLEHLRELGYGTGP